MSGLVCIERRAGAGKGTPRRGAKGHAKVWSPYDGDVAIGVRGFAARIPMRFPTRIVGKDTLNFVFVYACFGGRRMLTAP